MQPSVKYPTKIVVIFLAYFLVTLPAPVRAVDFDFEADTFAFANETHWEYDEQGRPQPGVRRQEMPSYTRRCFIMVRAAQQFHRMARFDPTAPALDRCELRQRVRRIVRTGAWRPSRAPEDRVVIPGFDNLRQFSNSEGRLLQEEMGGGLITYARIANWRVAMPFPRRSQQETAEWLMQRLDEGEVAAVMMTRRLARINHAVIVYEYRVEKDRIRFRCYDPNNTEASVDLLYDPKERTFSWPATDYFGGGAVNLFPIYRSCLQ